VRKIRKEYIFHSKEEKAAIVKRYLAGESPAKLHRETGISDGNIRKWKRQYLAGGQDALINKKRTGNPLSKYTRKKELNYEEQLEYQVAVLKRELLKKEAEILRLKKSIKLEGGDTRRN
jgi:Transposase.